ncbi:MAG: potassium transporter TrkG, partial [Deinococcales bacterium]
MQDAVAGGRAQDLVEAALHEGLATGSTAGAALLTAAYVRHGDALPRALWRGIFHAVSAFCNAGFALQSDSLVMFQHDPFA